MRRRKLIFLTGISFLAFFIGSAAQIRAENKTVITFVASGEELDQALSREESIRGLAVRSEFYDSSTYAVKKKMDELVERIANTLIPIFIYGAPERLEILEKWFPRMRGQLQCAKPAAGIFPTITVADGLAEMIADDESNLAGAHFFICIIDIEAISEKEFREQINASWEIEQKSLKEEGYGTLN